MASIDEIYADYSDDFEESSLVHDDMFWDIFEEDTSISVPGGLSERPTARPYDLHDISIPSGSHKQPYDLSSISIPKSTSISADVYNRNIRKIQDSFKECIDVLSTLQRARVVDDYY